jgi:hypothetical protein
MQRMRHTDNSIRVGGTWFAVASFLMVMVLLLHGPISPDLSEQMTRVSGSVMRWFVAHWIAAAGLSLHAVAGLIILGSQSRLTRPKFHPPGSLSEMVTPCRLER